MTDLLAEILRAEHRLRGEIRETPLEPSPALSALAGADVWLKLESWQHTGSFKARGALNKLLCLTPEERGRGIVTASTGNHGAAVAHGAARVGAPALVFVPHTADPSKVERIRTLGAEVVFHGDDSAQSEARARRHAEERGMVYLSPYNDWQVIAGQGTIGVEIARQLEAPDAVVVSVGGGGLIAGIASYLRAARPGIRVLGCSPRNSAVMFESLRRGAIVELPSLPTLSDGTAGGVEPGAITFPLCRDLVDDFELVEEPEVAAAMRLVLDRHHWVIEGAAGVAVAALLKQADRWRGKRVVVVICGGNVSLEVLRKVLEQGQGTGDRGPGDSH